MNLYYKFNARIENNNAAIRSNIVELTELIRQSDKPILRLKDNIFKTKDFRIDCKSSSDERYIELLGRADLDRYVLEVQNNKNLSKTFAIVVLANMEEIRSDDIAEAINLSIIKRANVYMVPNQGAEHILHAIEIKEEM